MSAVYGPSEVRMQRLQVDQAYVETVFRPKSGVPGKVEKLLLISIWKIYQKCSGIQNKISMFC